MVVVGRSILVGSPVAKMLTHNRRYGGTLHTKDPEDCRLADILIVAAGKSTIDKNFVKRCGHY